MIVRVMDGDVVDVVEDVSVWGESGVYLMRGGRVEVVVVGK